MNQFSKIMGVGHYLPKKVVENKDFEEQLNTSDEWIRERTGIERRFLAEDHDTTSSLAIEASKKAIANAGIKASELDLIVACTLSPDYYFPGIGVQIQAGLQLPCIPAIDVRGQCSGFSWGLSTADAYIRGGLAKNVLLVGSEIHSRVIYYEPWYRNVAVLFGDGAGAVVMQATKEQPTPQNQARGIIDHVLGSDGTGIEFLAMRRPGMGAGHTRFVTHEDVEQKVCCPQMNGRQVFINAVNRMYQAITTLMDKNQLQMQDIDLIVTHQANLRISEKIREKLDAPAELFVNSVKHYGNTTAASIPLCMADAIADGRLKPGSLIITVAFGAGFAWGANLIRF